MKVDQRFNYTDIRDSNETYHYTVVEDRVRLQQPESDRITHIQVTTLIVIELLHIHQSIVLRIVDDTVFVKISSNHESRDFRS